ncbi:hypothetical protein RHSIM_Rhsim06G0106400 [Rhododendron simsii]|uniref:non-specific serine/threonine protein kinase n=1 Tax=Rhododendron simsii TaxID=118357 RepID=A0A834LIF0_RHOSS|nr:hypothetical protein RHSIM_Rhsim06G0106400 [Rhododendron simsii]
MNTIAAKNDLKLACAEMPATLAVEPWEVLAALLSSVRVISIINFRMLVYEYVNNGNLEQWLHGAMCQCRYLTWEACMKVLLGNAKAGFVSHFRGFVSLAVVKVPPCHEGKRWESNGSSLCDSDQELMELKDTMNLESSYNEKIGELMNGFYTQPSVGGTVGEDACLIAVFSPSFSPGDASLVELRL